MKATSSSRFLLLCGVSGVGKTTILEKLCCCDHSFTPVPTFTTRHLRPGERHKVCVKLQEIEKMQKVGAVLFRTEIYGAVYGTPRYPIEAALQKGRFPVLEWPVENINAMQRLIAKIFTVYLKPPSLYEWMRRLSTDERDHDESRLKKGLRELQEIEAGRWKDDVKLFLVNDHPISTAELIRNKVQECVDAFQLSMDCKFTDSAA